MKRFIWLAESVVHAVHDQQLAEHGGSAGIRDAGLLSSALARARHLAAYGAPDAADCAAAYAFGIARNHPFIDGNKRTAFVALETFLNLNGFELHADDAAAVDVMLRLAGGELTEPQLSDWIRSHVRPRAGTRARR